MIPAQEAELQKLTNPKTEAKAGINSGKNYNLPPLLQLLRNRN